MSKYKELFSEDWYDELKDYIESEDFRQIFVKINKDRESNIVIPYKGSNTFFRCFREPNLSEIKVVIFGQDLYPTIESNKMPTFDGLAFSNANSLNPSPSLRNILKEVKNCYPETDHLDELDLTRWARQGVLLINTAHSVIKDKPGSHLKIWELFTLHILKVLNKKNDLVWLLMGREAQKLGHLVDNRSHTIINVGHPSPLNTSVPFLGTNCFKLVNEELGLRNKKEIIW